MFAYKVIHRVESVEHVYIVMAPDSYSAKRKIAEANGWTSFAVEEHPWHPRCGMWSAKEMTEDDGPFKLYELNLRTGDMTL